MISQKVIEMERIGTKSLYEMVTAWAEQSWDGVQYTLLRDEWNEEETKDRLIYNLIKHPQYPLRKEQEDRPNRKMMAATLPLSFFIDGLEE
jgi:hypothetical protein